MTVLVKRCAGLYLLPTLILMGRLEHRSRLPEFTEQPLSRPVQGAIPDTRQALRSSPAWW